MNQFCLGRLSITPGRMAFIADSGEHSIVLLAADLKDFTLLGGDPGRFGIKAAGKSYVFRVRTQTRAEAVLLGSIAEENLKR